MAAAVPPGSFAVPPLNALPVSVQRYAATGKPPNTILRDLVTVSNQVPRWGYFALAAFATLRAWNAWKSSQSKPKREATEKLTP